MLAKARALPSDRQDALAAEIERLLDEKAVTPIRSAADQKAIEDRLAQPFVEAPREALGELYARYRSS